MPWSDLQRFRTLGSGVPDELPSLLECPSAIDVAVSYAEFREHTKLDHDEVISEAVVVVPLPRYSDTRARWSGVPASMLWHPAFWLPGRIAERRTHNDMAEPDPVWAIRICLELEGSGWYRPGSGWGDVLAENGIDIDTQADLDRVQAWQNGAADAVLDNLDLGITDSDEQWQVQFADSLVDQLLGRAWATHADEMIGWIDEVDQGSRSARGCAGDIASLAPGLFAGALVPDLAPGADAWEEIARMVDDHDLSEEETRNGPLRAAQAWLVEARAHYWPRLDQLQQHAQTALAELR